MRLLSVAVLLVVSPLSAQWVQLNGPSRPDYQVSYDARRHHVVMFGLEGGTWEFDGTTRLQRQSLSGVQPPGRSRSAMATNPDRGITLLFGGQDNNGYRDDTWLWDGNSWRELTGTPSPTARRDGAMAFDRARGRFVYQGGQSNAGLEGTTWEHDGTQWIQTTVQGPLEQRCQMVFDPGRNVVVLVSSAGIQGAPLEVSEYDGNAWVALTPTGSWPTNRQNVSLAHDEGRNCIVMFGGTPETDEVWEYDGATWTLVHHLPTKFRSDAPAYYDPDLGGVVAVGGKAGIPVEIYTDAHLWDGTTFSQVRTGYSPPQALYQRWFSDPVRRRAILFGGRNSSTIPETWQWDGSRWQLLQPGTTPPYRTAYTTTFDTTRGVGLMYGGSGPGSYRSDFWQWDGANWSQLVNGPPARAGAAMSFDDARGVAMVFGGVNGPLFQSTSLLGDTWEWNGSEWTQREAVNGPAPREGASMAYDAARGVTVLYGGRVGATAGDRLHDTWQWDGTAWTEVGASPGFTPLSTPSMAYDATRSRIVVAGLQNFNLDLWEFDGNAWSFIASTPQLVSGADLIWDHTRDSLTLFDSSAVLAWTSTPATGNAYGSGCGSAPWIGLRTRPRIGDPEFGLEAHVNPNQLTAFVLGNGPVSVPIAGGCTLLVNPLFALPAVGDANGNALFRIPLSVDSTFRGATLYTQAVVIDSATPLAAGTSQGVQFTLGH